MEDVVIASVALVGRTGARELEVGFQHDDVPAHLADWYAHASYKGTRIITEHHPGPAEALQALAARLFTGAKCTHCGGLVALSDQGATYMPGGIHLDGTVLTPEEAQALPQCRWRRDGRTWIRGCAT